MRPVAVIGLEADNQQQILVVVCLDPIDAYANRNGKHLGHIREGKLDLVRYAVVSDRESALILRAYQALRLSLDNLK